MRDVELADTQVVISILLSHTTVSTTQRYRLHRTNSTLYDWISASFHRTLLVDGVENCKTETAPPPVPLNPGANRAYPQADLSLACLPDRIHQGLAGLEAEDVVAPLCWMARTVAGNQVPVSRFESMVALYDVVFTVLYMLYVLGFCSGRDEP